MKKDVMIVTGAGQIGMAIARRVGFGKRIILGDKSMKNAETTAKIMNDAGYDVLPFEMDLSSREDILSLIHKPHSEHITKVRIMPAIGTTTFSDRFRIILKILPFHA